MTDYENLEAVELNLEDLDLATGGYKRPAEKAGFIIYQIVKGDTLIRIAARFHCTVNDILKWNPKITNRSLIYAGDYLYIKA